MELIQQRNQELIEEFYEDWHPSHKTPYDTMLVSRLIDTETKAARWEAVAGELAETLNFVGWVNDQCGHLICPWCRTEWSSDCPETCSKQAALAAYDALVSDGR